MVGVPYRQAYDPEEEISKECEVNDVKAYFYLNNDPTALAHVQKFEDESYIESWISASNKLRVYRQVGKTGLKVYEEFLDISIRQGYRIDTAFIPHTSLFKIEIDVRKYMKRLYRKKVNRYE